MSDAPDPGAGVPQESDPGVEQMPVEEPRRSASLTLRTDDVREFRAVSMEAANKSLTDALRITYRLLQLVMIALVVLFLFSGFQQVNQAETGIRVDLGRIKADNLEPGFQFSWPYPLGEILKVERGNRTMQIDESFWPRVAESQRGRSLDELSLTSGSLKPGEDGSLLTADSNIAHAQLTVLYSVARPAEFVRNIYQDSDRRQERTLIRSAVERAAVRVIAASTIDDLLKRGGLAAPSAEGEAAGGAEATPGASDRSRQENSIESQVRRVAQETLDAINSGIEISQVLLRSASPPVPVRKTFNDVQIAQSNAGKVRDQALADRSKTLNEVAGSAAGAVLHAIDKYELALELGDKAEAERIFAEISNLLEGKLDGRNVEIEGRKFDDVRIAGDVASMISDAQQHRSSVVQQAQRQADTFRAKRAQYQANPMVFASNEWAEAFKAFITRPNVEVMIMPTDSDGMELLLTSDPEIARDAERERFGKDVDENLRLQKMPGSN